MSATATCCSESHAGKNFNKGLDFIIITWGAHGAFEMNRLDSWISESLTDFFTEGWRSLQCLVTD